MASGQHFYIKGRGKTHQQRGKTSEDTVVSQGHSQGAEGVLCRRQGEFSDEQRSGSSFDMVQGLDTGC